MSILTATFHLSHLHFLLPLGWGRRCKFPETLLRRHSRLPYQTSSAHVRSTNSEHELEACRTLHFCLPTAPLVIFARTFLSLLTVERHDNCTTTKTSSWTGMTENSPRAAGYPIARYVLSPMRPSKGYSHSHSQTDN